MSIPQPQSSDAGSPMRVAYVALRLRNPSSGVYWKTLQQATAARAAGVDCDFYYLHTGPESYQSENLCCIRVEPPRTGIGKAVQLAFRRYAVLAKHTDLERYDRIVLRHVKGGHLSYLSFFRQYPGRVVSEHHTKEIPEIWAERGGLCSLLGEAFLMPRILDRCVGIIGVTNDIREYQCGRLKRHIPSATISNGVNVDDEWLTGFRPFDGRRLDLIFVAAEFRPWHGLDRLVTSLGQYRGQVMITVRLVGEVCGADLNRIRRLSTPRTQIQIVRTCAPDELRTLFGSANLAVSSLALDRNGLLEGCVLKTRQYMAKGIPFMYGYTDCDLDSDFPFALKVDTRRGAFDLEPIIDFAAKVSSMHDVPEQMRQYARERMSWKCKIRQLYDFVTRLA